MTLAVGCASGCATDQPGGSGDSFEYHCDEVAVPLEALERGVTADRLGADGQEALRGLEVPPIDPAEWIVVEESSERVMLLRELDEPDDRGAGDHRTHEMLGIEWVDAPNLDPSPTWMYTRGNTCALRTDLGGLDAADVTLDPANPTEPTDAAVHLLVTERACASGKAADGRVRLVEIVEGTETVDVVVGVEPQSGEHACPSNPPTPFVVELTEPLGDRVVRDAGVHPHRRLVMPDATSVG
jgi:hypothetical protein